MNQQPITSDLFAFFVTVAFIAGLLISFGICTLAINTSYKEELKKSNHLKSVKRKQ